MKINMPVTNEEHFLKENESIVSKTDLKGRITYVNEEFIRISGFSLEELIGKSHNIVRHPDVPVEVYEDLWKTLKSGRPWSGVVKNRCKNGDFYWVIANITPFYENDQLVGYLSVRGEVSPEKIEEAKAVYQIFRDGKAGNLKFQNGKIVKLTLLRRLNVFKKLSIRSGLVFVISMLSLLMTVIGVIGLWGMSKSNEGLHSVYMDRTVTMSLVYNISELQRKNLMLVAGSLVNSSPENIHNNTTQLDQNIAEITVLWNKYLTTSLKPKEKTLADNFTQNRTRFVQKGLIPAIAALRSNDFALADKIRKQDIIPLYKPANKSAKFLMQFQIDAAKAEYGVSQSRYKNIRNIFILLVLMGVTYSLWQGLCLINLIVRPLRSAIGYFNKISQGDYSNNIEIERYDEIGKMMETLKSTQIKCGFDIAEIKRIADEHARIKDALDDVSTGVIITNNAHDIIYANKSVFKLFGKAEEEEVRHQLPSFSIANLVGTNISCFYKDPLYLTQIISSLNSTYKVNVKIASRTFVFTINPVITDEGKRLGTIAEFREWEDRSNDVMIESDIQLVLNALSHSDLTVTITNDYSGRFAKIKNDANSTVENLKNLFYQIKKVIDNLNSEDKENAANKNYLSQCTEEQFGNKGESTFAEQYSAVNYKRATQLIDESPNIADKGTKVINQGVLKMDGIRESSQQIRSIISVIDDIVLQTKMLAHTAAIEAGRAGDKGDGFASVATEMRNIAQYAATDAEEIKKLLDDALSKVDDSNIWVTQADLTMKEIVNFMREITVTMSDISEVSETQMACIKQINQAIGKWTV